MRFEKTYASLSLLLLTTETVIAFFVHDAIVRPFIGDLLVVILLYCMARTFTGYSIFRTAFSVLGIAYAVEKYQYFHLIYRLGWQHSTIARVTLGTSFSVTDLGMYTIGFLIIIAAEYMATRKRAFKL